MEILEILNKQGVTLYPEDLDFFETELATGGIYDAAYQAQCRSKIKELRSCQKDGGQPKKDQQTPSEKLQQTEPAQGSFAGLTVKLEDLTPKEENPAAASPLTTAQLVAKDLEALREGNDYKTSFKKYIAGKPEIDADFVDKHYAIFRSWELDAMLSVRQMGEAYLEKYFGALDKDKIARYQKFSESFFMKHYSQLDASVVLEHGKNNWRKKENRSKQLDVFLRLKGWR